MYNNFINNELSTARFHPTTEVVSLPAHSS